MFFDHETRYIKESNPVEVGFENNYVVLTTTGEDVGNVKVKAIMTDSTQIGEENFLIPPRTINTEAADTEIKFGWYAWEE
jgi:hypothetical protein